MQGDCHHPQQKSQFFPIAVCIAPILYITSELVLPIKLTFSQGLVVATLHLVYDLNCHILVTTTPLPPIMMAQTTILPLDLLLVAAVPKFEFSRSFPHILALAFGTGSQIHNKLTVAV